MFYYSQSKIFSSGQYQPYLNCWFAHPKEEHPNPVSTRMRAVTWPADRPKTHGYCDHMRRLNYPPQVLHLFGDQYYRQYQQITSEKIPVPKKKAGHVE